MTKQKKYDVEKHIRWKKNQKNRKDIKEKLKLNSLREYQKKEFDNSI